MRTTLSLAISAALLSTSGSLSAADKYQFGSAELSEVHIEISSDVDSQQSSITEWLVILDTDSVTEAQQTDKKMHVPTRLAQDQLARITAMYDTVERFIAASGDEIEVIGHTNKILPAMIVKGTKADVLQLQTLKQIRQIMPILPSNDKPDITGSAVYMGATELITSGQGSGNGVKIGIVDSGGVDWTHTAFGGSGLLNDYKAALAGRTAEPNWPHGRIVGGWDFISKDPNPFYEEGNSTHGTRVSHSALGIALDAEGYMYTVCGSSCSSSAQLLAYERSLDPNNDGDISDRLDITNTSLGSDFGDAEESSRARFLKTMTELGILSVLSAGNDGDWPFITGSTSTAADVISVGALMHPSEKTNVANLTISGNKIKTAAASFNPGDKFNFSDSGNALYYPTINSDGCLPFAEQLTTKGVVIDRGNCAFALKVQNAQQQGAAFVLIANNTGTDELSTPGGSPGSIPITIPSAMISKNQADVLKQTITQGTPAYSLSFEDKFTTDAIADFSSRGPSLGGLLKPDLVAPGQNISMAKVGSGSELEKSNGTSFSSPMTAGAAAIIKEIFPDRNAYELKATLMNSANPNIYMDPPEIAPETTLAPVSRIGAGLVDLKKAATTQVIAWDKTNKQPSLAFGLLTVPKLSSFTKTVEMKNFGSSTRHFIPRFRARFANDEASGALQINLPETVSIAAGQTSSFDVTVTIAPEKLPSWALTSTPDNLKDASAELTKIEYDGYLEFLEGNEVALQMPVHMLPKAQGSISTTTELIEDKLRPAISNSGVVDFDKMLLLRQTAIDANEPALRHDIISVASEVLTSDECSSGYGIYHTFITRDPILHVLQASYQVDYDLDNNGIADYRTSTIYLRDINSKQPASVGSITSEYPLTLKKKTARSAYHLSGNNFVTTKACFEDLGLTQTDVGKTVAVSYRIEESASWNASQSDDADTVSASISLAPATSLPKLTDRDGQEIDSIKKGEMALISYDNASDGTYLLLSEKGSFTVPLNFTDSANNGPVVDDLSLSVNKGVQPGTLLGRFTITDPDPLTSPVSEVIVLESNNNLLNINRSGEVTLKQGWSINQETETLTAKVVAVDTLGNRSNEALLRVEVINRAPTVSMPPITATSSQAVVLAATATDEDGDQLSLSFRQTGGDTVSFVQENQQIRFTAPANAGTLTFSFTADDGRASAVAFATVTVTKPAIPAPQTPPPQPDGGSLGWSLLMLPLLSIRRRLLAVAQASTR